MRSPVDTVLNGVWGGGGGAREVSVGAPIAGLGVCGWRYRVAMGPCGTTLCEMFPAGWRRTWVVLRVAHDVDPHDIGRLRLATRRPRLVRRAIIAVVRSEERGRGGEASREGSQDIPAVTDRAEASKGIQRVRHRSRPSPHERAPTSWCGASVLRSRRAPTRENQSHRHTNHRGIKH